MEELKKINRRLKLAKVGVTIKQVGDRLYLRATLPPKPGETKPKQRDLTLGIYANPAGLKRAEAEARKLGGQLACKEFSWEDWLKPEQKPIQLLGVLIERFEKDYFSRRARTAKSETTWRTEYRTVFSQLPSDQPASAEILQDVILAKSEPDTRTRKRYCMVLGQFAKFAGIKLDVSRLAGSYSPSSVSPRDLMSDAEIVQWRQRIPNPAWKYVFGLMATYGLRNHEVFHIDFESLQQEPGILVVREGKTGSREVYPFYPEWWQQWQLWKVYLPKVSGRDNSALGMRVTQALKRYGFLKPYNLRHAWAIRTLEFGLPIELAAAQMGHSLSVHSRIYHRWIKRDHHQRVFELLMNRSDRPLPP